MPEAGCSEIIRSELDLGHASERIMPLLSYPSAHTLTKADRGHHVSDWPRGRREGAG